MCVIQYPSTVSNISLPKICLNTEFVISQSPVLFKSFFKIFFSSFLFFSFLLDSISFDRESLRSVGKFALDWVGYQNEVGLAAILFRRLVLCLCLSVPACCPVQFRLKFGPNHGHDR